jgi:predicted ATP-grasp superfamily ATP-dependent carboligase
MNIAVFNTEARKAVPIVRSLGEAGYAVYSFSFERLSFAGFSRHVQKNVYVRDYDLDHILQLLKQYRIEAILPIEDPSIEFLGTNREHFGEYLLIMPEHDTFSLFADKANTMQYAIEKGVAVPETFIPTSVEEALEYISNETRFPLVIKPRRSTSAIGVRVVINAEEAARSYRELSQKFHLPLIQEYIPPGGKALGAEFLFHRGREILSFSHLRIREYPVRGGPSTYCRDYKNDDAIIAARRLFASLCYSGFAMVEFKEHPDTKELFLIEVNPRPWGSITLPISAGVNFPAEAVRVFSDPDGCRPSPNGYDPGRDYYMRWFLPGDMLSIATTRTMPFREKLGSLFRRYTDTAYQILSWRDPLPALVLTVKLALNAFNPSYVNKYILRKW